jgi:hypothetical protein
MYSAVLPDRYNGEGWWQRRFRFFGSAGQEPDVPAPRVSDASPFSDPGSGLPEMRFTENEVFSLRCMEGTLSFHPDRDTTKRHNTGTFA